MDWQVYLPFADKFQQPIINLIQHVRHADSSHELSQFLSYPAIRICVSSQVAEAIAATGRVNGPVITIPNGVDLPPLSTQIKTTSVLILGIKNPVVAQQLRALLVAQGMVVDCIDRPIPRLELYKRMAASRMAVLLPHATEGFYLPALEAMQYCDITIVPDCVGNRGFCQSGVNCLMPSYNLESLFAAVREGEHRLANEQQPNPLHLAGVETVAAHHVGRERDAYHQLLSRVESLWRELV